MKKITMMFAAVICCAMTAIVFSSCGDDESPAATDRTPVAAAMEYKMELGDQMLALFNMTIEYYDSDGTLKSEPMTQNTWTKKVRAKLPVTLGMRVRGQVKPGVDIDSQEKIFCSYGYSCNGYAVSATDLVVGNIENNGSSTSYEVSSETKAEWVQHIINGFAGFLVDFDANGRATSSRWN